MWLGNDEITAVVSDRLRDSNSVRLCMSTHVVGVEVPRWLCVSIELGSMFVLQIYSV
jgi:hypothetical protein